MAQRVTIAILAMVAVGMAASAYLSCSAGRHQREQLTVLNDRLARLDDRLGALERQEAVQAATNATPPTPPTPPATAAAVATTAPTPLAPTGARAHLFAGTPANPVVGYKVPMWDQLLRATTVVTTDAKGCVSLQPSVGVRRFYTLSGPILDADGKPRGGGRWSRAIEVGGHGLTPDVQIDVAPRGEYQVRFDMPSVKWDARFPRRFRVRFEQHTVGQGGSYTPMQSGWTSESYVLNWPDGANRITGLYAGAVKTHVDLLGVVPEGGVVLASLTADVSIPEQPGPVVVKIEPVAAKQVAGVLFDGSRSHGLAGKTVRLLGEPAPARVPGSAALTRPSEILEYLVTSARGEFTALSPGGSNPKWIVMPWQTTDGKPADLVWPLAPGFTRSYDVIGHGALCEMDVAQLGTARLALTGVDKLLKNGVRFVSPLQITPVIHASTLVAGTNRPTTIDAMTTSVDPTKQTSLDLLFLGGAHSARLSMVLAQANADAPELESYKSYSHEYPLQVQPGRVTEVPVPLDELNKWKLDKTEWHKRDVPTTQSQPAGR